MHTQTIRNLLISLTFAAGLSACATSSTVSTTSAESQDTHFWQAARPKTERDYKRDQSRCSETHQVQTTEPMEADSLSFEGYRSCMLERGYVLRTY